MTVRKTEMEIYRWVCFICLAQARNRSMHGDLFQLVLLSKVLLGRTVWSSFSLSSIRQACFFTAVLGGRFYGTVPPLPTNACQKGISSRRPCVLYLLGRWLFLTNPPSPTKCYQLVGFRFSRICLVRMDVESFMTSSSLCFLLKNT